MSLYPIKLAFLIWDQAFKIIPISGLSFLSGFQVTKKNLSIAFPELNEQELNDLAKESYKETFKSFYETLYTWSRSDKKIISHTKKDHNMKFKVSFSLPGSFGHLPLNVKCLESPELVHDLYYKVTFRKYCFLNFDLFNTKNA